MEMIITNLISGVFLLILGLIVQTGKANFLIAGYNTMSKAEKAKVNAVTMSKFVGWIILVIPSIILLLACIPIALDIFPYVTLIISWIMFIVILIGGVIYMNLSPRFKRSN